MNALAAAFTTVALVATAWSARRVVLHRAADLPSYGAGALWAALCVAVPLVSVGLFGRAVRSFDAGLGAYCLAALALAAYAYRIGSPPASRPQPAKLWVTIAGTVAIGLLYAVIARMYQMHDEVPIFGHKSMVEQLRYGEYPPYFPPIPSQDARYHYGFDVLAGMLARAYGLSADTSIDLVTVAMVLFLSWAAAALVADAGAEIASPFAAVAIHLGAGMSWLTLAGVPGRHPRCLIQYHHPSCGVELFPTPILNIFQHPVSVGVPMALVALMLLKRVVEAEKPPRWVLRLLALVLPALVLGQVVYFALTLLAALAATIVLRRWRQAGLVLGLMVVAVLVGRLMGGMLEPSDIIDGGLIKRRMELGFPKLAFMPIVEHHAANLGVGLFLLPGIAVWAYKKRNFHALALSLFAAGGTLIIHVFFYKRSWDIVKFPSAAAFALTLLYVLAVDAKLRGGGPIVPWIRRGGRALLLGSGILAAIWLVFPMDGDKRLYDLGTGKPDAIVARAIGWWRGQPYDRHAVILAQSNVAQELAVYGGLSVVASDSDFFALGVKQELLGKQDALGQRARATLDPTALKELGVRYLVYSDEELQNLGPIAQQKLTSSTAVDLTVVATFDGDEPKRRRRIWAVEPVKE